MCCPCTHTHKTTSTNQNKGGYPVFPRAHLSQNSCAWQGGCYCSYHSPHYEGLCGKETSLIVFSQTSFLDRGLQVAETASTPLVVSLSLCSLLRGLPHWDAVSPSALSANVTPPPGLISSRRSMWRRAYCTNMYGHTSTPTFRLYSGML